MNIKTGQLIERLYQHEDDYTKGRTQDFSQVCADCKMAADIITALRTSKHTQKRRRQRLSKKNREKDKKIESLMAEIEKLKERSSD